jgi:LuxR family transcriptional regulator, maltose regulon positive regulatory protein
MTEPLLIAKLSSPPLPSRLIQRQSLLDFLESSHLPDTRLILVSAPAGYGKTTLVCAWLRNASHVCWLSLEQSDNDPRVFFTYLVASLQKASPALGKEARELLKIPQLPPLQTILTSILNDLAVIDEDLIIVLDDYQHIHISAIHTGLAFLLDHLPANKHIVITTRSDPPMALHRYRSRGQMVEIRAEELRFSPAEIADYMEGMTGLHLNAWEIDTLEKRTEGWPAGLQMAAISLRGKADPRQFIESLAGTNRYILDYLLEETLNQQRAEVQRFLMETSILDRLCPPLCDAVLQAEKGTSQELLQYLEHENLFIISLDDERYWYRYHHLFRDLLEMRLKHTAAERIKALHRMAAEWFASTGEIDQAVHHCIQGQDFEHAADLVEQHAHELFMLGRLDQLLGWTQKLPAALSERRAWLSVYQAWTLAFAGNNAEAETLIGIAMRAVAQTPYSLETQKKILVEIHGIRALVAITSGNLQEPLRLYGLLDTEVSADSLFARSVVLWAAGYAWRMQGQLAKATEMFRQVLAIGKNLKNLWTMSTAYVDLGMALRLSGRLKEADSLYREGLEVICQAGTSGLGYVGRLESFFASTLYEQSLLDEAIQQIASSITHNELWKNPNHVAHAYMIQARILMGKGDASAEEALKRAADAARHPAVVPALRVGIDALTVQFWLENGQQARAGRWVEAQSFAAALGKDTETLDLETLTRARVLIAQDNKVLAWKILDELEIDARAAGRVETLIKALTLKALASLSSSTALKTLEAALQLGIPEGYRRVFLDEGEKVLSLIAGLRDRSDLVKPLLDLTGEKSKKEQAILTTRELEILRGMAEGLSNKEIGQQLFISAGTVKAHSAAIYRKLEVENRTEAIARAKDLGLI